VGLNLGMKKKIKNIVNKYPRLLPVILPFAWIFILIPLLSFLPDFMKIDLMCTRFNGIPQLFLSYVLWLIPNWICLFISEKKSNYVAVIIIYGTFCFVGVIAYYGMNCGIDWLQE
jgi:hypothetical protein